MCDNPLETAPSLVTGPVLDLMHPALNDAWQINQSNQMCFIFDVVNPAQQFKRGTRYDDSDDDPFPEYDPNPEEDPNVTESDLTNGPKRRPYKPVSYR
jgi:hypothetical protein